MAVPTQALLSLLAQKQQADQYATEQMQQGAAAMVAPQAPAPLVSAEVKPRVTPPVTDWQQHDVLGAKRAMGLESQAIDHANQKDLLEYKAKLQQRMRRGTGVGPVTKLVNEILHLSTTTADSPEQRQQIEKRIQVRMSQLEGLGRAGQTEAQRIKQFAVPTIPGGGEKFSQQRAMQTLEGQQKEADRTAKYEYQRGKDEARREELDKRLALMADLGLVKAGVSPGAMVADLPSNPAAKRLESMATGGGRQGAAGGGAQAVPQQAISAGYGPGDSVKVGGVVYVINGDGKTMSPQ